MNDIGIFVYGSLQMNFTEKIDFPETFFTCFEDEKMTRIFLFQF